MWCVASQFPFFIEAKAPRGMVTDRQRMLIDKLHMEHGCKVFVIHDAITLQELVGMAGTIRGQA